MLKPMQDYIVVRPIIRKQSDVLEVISHEKHCRGEVIAVGPGKLDDKKGRVMPLDSRPGDIIAFGNGDFDFYPYWRKENPDGTYETYRIVQEADIVGIEERLDDKAMGILKTEIDRLIPECAA